MGVIHDHGCFPNHPTRKKYTREIQEENCSGSTGINSSMPRDRRDEGGDSRVQRTDRMGGDVLGFRYSHRRRLENGRGRHEDEPLIFQRFLICIQRCLDFACSDGTRFRFHLEANRISHGSRKRDQILLSPGPLAGSIVHIYRTKRHPNR